MNAFDDGSGADELARVADRLREERVQATPLELDRVKLRALGSRRRVPHLGKGVPLKSRLLIVAVLTLGIVFSGTGATLALSGIAQNGTLDATQYVQPSTESGGSEDGGGTGGETLGGNSEVAGTSNSNESSDGDDSEVLAQTSASGDDGGSGDSLPLTGFAALPLLLAGLALLTGGLVLRRRVSSAS